MSRALGSMPLATRLAGKFFTDPLSYMSGKPMERWLMVFDLPSRKLALANDPSVVETVMLDRGGEFPKSTVLHDLLQPLIGGGVFGQPGGAEVKETRRIYARSLATIADTHIEEVTRRTTAAYITRWLATPGQTVPITEELSRLTVDIVSECTLGTTFDAAQSKRFTQLFFDFQQKTMPLVLMLTRQDAETRRQVVRDMELHAVGAEMRDLIRERFVNPIYSGSSAVAAAPFPRALAEAGRLVDSTEGREATVDEIAVMLLAGHETTASSLSWMAWELASRPSVQETASAVLRSAPLPVGGDAGRLGSASPAEVIEALSKEILRLYPPIGFFLRENERDVEFREKPIPSRSFVIVAPWTLHRHRKFWRQPDDFLPDRWLAGEPAPLRTSYMPFGLGARSCPGARFAAIEMTGIIRAMLLNVVLATNGREQPKPLGNLTSRPDQEIHLGVTPRQPGLVT
ncbi:MAG: cytochrome P450 [Hyphomicrobium sp.]